MAWGLLGRRNTCRGPGGRHSVCLKNKSVGQGNCSEAAAVQVWQGLPRPQGGRSEMSCPRGQAGWHSKRLYWEGAPGLKSSQGREPVRTALLHGSRSQVSRWGVSFWVASGWSSCLADNLPRGSSWWRARLAARVDSRMEGSGRLIVSSLFWPLPHSPKRYVNSAVETSHFMWMPLKLWKLLILLLLVFDILYASELWEYRHGIPGRPRKCCGKKVIFTPTNIITK